MEQFFTDAAPVKLTTTPEGYLRGRAVVTRTGVFAYQDAQGRKQGGLRHPDDVLKQSSLDSLKQIPVTLGHPPQFVNAENSRSYQVGFTGETVETNDQGHIIASFTITDAVAIKAIKSKNATQLSLGYNLEMVDEQGTYDNEPYHFRQTQIKYNHLAIVDKARAGPVTTMTVDAIGELKMTTELKETRAVLIDGLQYQALPEVANAMAKTTTALDKAEADKAELVKANDTLQAKFDGLEVKVKDLEKAIDEAAKALPEAVATRLSLIDRASKLVDTKGFEALTDRQIMEKAIASKVKGFEATDRSDHYIMGRFEGLLEDSTLSTMSVNSQKQAVDKVATGEKPVVKTLADGFMKTYNEIKGAK